MEARTRGPPEYPPTMNLFSVGRDTDLNLLGVGLFALGHTDRQDAITVFSANRFGIDGVRERKAAREGAIGALDTQVVIFAGLLLEFAFTAHGECVVLDAHINFLFIHVRQIGFHDELVFSLKYVHGRRPSGQVGLAGAVGTKGIVKQAIDLFLQRVESTVGGPTRNGVHVQSLLDRNSDYKRSILYAYTPVKYLF